MIVLIMLFISWLVNNHAWAYGALGLAVLSALLKATAQVKAAKTTQKEALEGVNDFLKSLQAKLN